MKRPFRFAALAALCVFGFSACIFGGGSDTTSGAEGRDPKETRLFFPSGALASGIEVTLYPPDYNPLYPDKARLRSTVTDDRGYARFRNVDSGTTYNLLARDARTGLVAFAPGRTLRQGFGRVLLAEPWNLALSLTAPAPDTFGLPGLAYVPGSDLRERWCRGGGATCHFLLPRGAVELRIEGTAAGDRPAWGRTVPLSAPLPGGAFVLRNLRVSPDGSRDSLWDSEVPW